MMKQRTMILTECMVMFQAPVLVTEKASIFQIYISIYLYISIYIQTYIYLYIHGVWEICRFGIIFVFIFSTSPFSSIFVGFW